MKKKMLIYANYYIPDVTSTGQILEELVNGLSEKYEINIICAVPSYGGHIENEYKKKKFYFEKIGCANVIRVRVPEFSKEKKISRIYNIVCYFINSILATYYIGKTDYIMTISLPPILGGVLGCIGKRIKKAKLIYVIQDFNPEQIIAIGYFKNKIVLKLLMIIDTNTCKKSDLVITVGRDLVETLIGRFKDNRVPKCAMINNWADTEILYPLDFEFPEVDSFREKYGLKDKFVFMYSGNIGLYYDLENLLKAIDEIGDNITTPDGRQVVFVFVGDGGVKNKLVNYVERKRIHNVIFVPYQEKSKLVYSLNSCDVHICTNAKGIKGVSCPSKFYGILACKKPVLAVLEDKSEMQMLIEESCCGLCSFPEEYEEFKKNICWFIEHSNDDILLTMGENGYNLMKSRFSKDKSISKYMDEIDSL